MELSVDKNQTEVTFKINGEIDEQGAEVLKENFINLNKSNLKTLTLDLKKVTHIGSAGIGKLLLFYKDIAISGGELRIINVSDTIYSLFLTLKLDSVFKIEKT